MDALRCSCLFQSYISVGKTPDIIRSNFEMWWDSEGRTWLSGVSANSAEDDDVESEDEEGPDAEDAKDDDDELAFANNLQEEEAAAQEDSAQNGDESPKVLQNLEDHAAMKGELAKMALASETEELEEPECEEEVMPPPANVNFSFKGLLNRWTDYEDFDMSQADAVSMKSCQSRVLSMMKGIQKFAEQIRIREGILSEAQITGEVKAKSEWRTMQHELALARAASFEHGGRISRCAAWAKVTKQLVLKTGGASVPADGSGVLVLHGCVII